MEELYLQEVAVAPEEPVDEQRPVTKEITAERREILLREEDSVKVAVKGPRLEHQAVYIAGDAGDRLLQSLRSFLSKLY